VVHGALHASFPADDSVETAEMRTPPTQNVLPKAVQIALSLVKPTNTFAQSAVLTISFMVRT
jgi:hypothetical protein